MVTKLIDKLPAFPNFEPVQFCHKPVFEAVTNQFELYSDYNFNSFYSWDIEGKNYISELNGNLVIQLSDYVTSEPVLSFMGDSLVDKTITDLLMYSEEKKLSRHLKLIPEHTIDLIENEEAFIITEDLDNHDYLFSIQELASLTGKRYKSKRHGAQRCEKTCSVDIRTNVTAKISGDQIIDFLDRWEISKHEHGKEVDIEYEKIAIKQILETLDEQPNLLLTCAYMKNALMGFSIDELLPGKFVLSHYFKSTPDVSGLSEYLNREVARNLLEMGNEIWNWEQDLGIESLKTMKESHRPIGKQKKYTITLKK